jgi:hypothetical protein
LGCQLEYLEEETFKLKQDNIELIRKNSTEHVVLPYRLIMNEGFVVSDELFKKLVPVKTEKFTGFFINEFEKTTGMGGSLVVDRVYHELNKIFTRQLILLFFVPIIVAIIHSTFAFIALQSMFTLSIASEMIVVLACFTTTQLIYFFFIRHHYLRKLKNALI